MKKPDELELLKYVVAGFFPRDAAKIIGMHIKRCHYICEKWSRKGWLTIGVSATLGSITVKGCVEGGPLVGLTWDRVGS